MCGIAGLVAVDEGAGLDPWIVERALDRLAHRGPDARAVRRGSGFVFGNVRLAIVDPRPNADQPMISEDERVVLTFNGEIFNHVALRRELEKHGTVFRGNSDTEVLLRAWLRWGPDALERLHGQFAFAVFDQRSSEAFLVRDRVGIKPLYYAHLGGTIAFGSEIPAVLAHPGCARVLDPCGISSFLSYRHAIGERTLFAGIRQLRPGHLAIVSRAGFQTRRYWRINLSQQDRDLPDVRAQRIRCAIRDAVRAQLPDEPSPLLLLSGGLDSTVLAMEIRSAGKGVIALTARVADADADESDDAAVTARQLGLEHVLVEMPRDQFIRDLEACVAMRGVPLGMHNEVAMHLLARAASRRSKVLFCGEGADELFGGYGRIFRLPFDHARARIADSLAEPVGRWIRDRLDLVESAAGRDERAFFSTRYTYFPRSDKLRLLTTEMQRKVSHDEALDGVLDEAFTYGRQRSLLDAISLVFLEVHLPGLLAMVDGATMASGVEGRVPFLDDRVVQAAFALPAGDKVAWRGPWSAVRAATEPIAQFSERRDQTKAILRRAYRTHVSAGVQARRKKGFPIPLEAWLGGSMGAHVEATLCGRSARLGDIVNLRRLSTWIRAGAAAPSAARAQQLMRFYTLELFLRKWC